MATDKEALKAKRHQLYCSITEALQHTGCHADTSRVLDRLQAVLEAEACLSCINDEGDSPLETTGVGLGNSAAPADAAFLAAASAADTTGVAAAARPALQHIGTAAHGSASSALQELKAELAQRVHESVRQPKQKLQQTKFLSCSALLADLRAAQRAKSELEDQLQAAVACMAKKDQKVHEELRRHKRAAEAATGIAEAANARLLEVEQQLEIHATDAAVQTKQLAEQARATVRLGAELRQVKQQMQELHESVVQPLLRWHHDQQQQNSGQRAASSKRRAWQPPAVPTRDTAEAAAAALELLLMEQAQYDEQLTAVRESVQQLSSCQTQHQLQASTARLDLHLQELRAELTAAQQDATAARQHSDDLQEQLAATTLQLTRMQQQCSSDMAVSQQAAEQAQQQQQQQLQDLQQQVNSLLSELACAQGEAAAAQRQVTRLQEEQQQAAAEQQERLEQLQQAANARLTQELSSARGNAEQDLHLQHAQALAAAQQEAQQALQQAQQAWQQERSALEKQHLQVQLRLRQALEEEKQQWQQERDQLVQQLTAKFTTTGMQMQQDAKEQLLALKQQVQQLQQERDALQQQLDTAAECTAKGRAPQQLSQLNAAQDKPGVPLQTLQQCLEGHTAASCEIAGAAVGSSCADPFLATQFSRALQTADADRSAAIKRAAAAEQTATELRRQLTQQEQELSHLRRALEELRSACSAAHTSAQEAEASAAASSSALQEQVVQVQQLQSRLDEAAERHQYELRALRESMTQQIRVIQSDARAELEAAQTRLQLVRLKQQRMAATLLGGGT